MIMSIRPMTPALFSFFWGGSAWRALRGWRGRHRLVELGPAELGEAACLHDLFLHAHLLLRRGFVQCGIVELLHPVLGLLDKAHGSLTHLHHLHVVGVLLLALL